MPPKSDRLWALVRRRVEDARSIAVVSHVRPDGDAVGSLLGLGLTLQGAGKQVQMLLADGVPGTYRHLTGADQVRRRAEGPPDLIVAVDSADLQRLGEALEGCPAPHVNIDHHPTNTHFAEINLVDEQAVATAAMLTAALPALGLPLDKPTAEALLTGIVTDTQGFRTANMNPQALRTAADLMEAGADLPELYERALVRRSFEAAAYWGRGLSQLQREDGLVWTSLSIADRQAADYPGKDDADLINVLATIESAAVALIFVEQAPDKVKVSWRAQEGYDVSRVAAQFGGGGHVAAAGAMVEGALPDVQARVLQATRSLFA